MTIDENSKLNENIESIENIENNENSEKHAKGTAPLDLTFTQAVMDWYRANRRDLLWRQDKEPYHVWVSEIMLQQTRVEAVKAYYQRFMDTLPTVQSLALADEETLLKLWQGLGYYNRIRNMHKAAKVISEELNGRFPTDLEEIRTLPGIGDYTAGAIASICFDRPTPAVDGNVLRVLARLLNDDSDISAAATKKRFTSVLAALYPTTGCGDFTQGLIELGALICIPKGKPLCGICPASAFCQAHRLGTELQLPYKAPKKARRVEQMTVLLLRYLETPEDAAATKAADTAASAASCESSVGAADTASAALGTETSAASARFAVCKRPPKVLLAGLYEFPNVTGKLTPDQALALAEQWGMQPVSLTRQREYTHVFTHVEWEMTAYYIDCVSMGNTENAEKTTELSENIQLTKEVKWVTRREMDAEIALPSAFGYFWDEK